jgi:hypothetical protein
MHPPCQLAIATNLCWPRLPNPACRRTNVYSIFGSGKVFSRARFTSLPSGRVTTGKRFSFPQKSVGGLKLSTPIRGSTRMEGEFEPNSSKGEIPISCASLLSITFATCKLRTRRGLGSKPYRRFESPSLRHLVLHCGMLLEKASKRPHVGAILGANGPEKTTIRSVQSRFPLLFLWGLRSWFGSAYSLSAKPLRWKSEQNTKADLTSAPQRFSVPSGKREPIRHGMRSFVGAELQPLLTDGRFCYWQYSRLAYPSPRGTDTQYPPAFSHSELSRAMLFFH